MTTSLTDGTREAAFTTAMLSAALAYKVALACIAKNVTECSCEKVEHSFRGESWKWTGCSVNVVFGSYTAARFMLSARSNNSQIDMMKMHNVRVGLEVSNDLCLQRIINRRSSLEGSRW